MPNKRVLPFPRLACYRRADGSIVVHVDTKDIPDNERGPVLTIYLNDDTDDPLWINPENVRELTAE